MTHKVINYFIKNSPVGEVHEVLGDLVKITGIDACNHQKVRDAIRNHLEDHRMHVKLSDNRMAMINVSERQADTPDG